MRPPPRSTLFPYTTLFRSVKRPGLVELELGCTLRTLMEDLGRSEEHTSELQSRVDLVCRLLLEKKNLRACEPPVADGSPGIHQEDECRQHVQRLLILQLDA